MIDGDNRIRIIIAGLVLAVIAVGYIIFSQKFTNSQTKVQNSVTPTPIEQTTSTPEDQPIDSALPQTTKGGLSTSGVSTLPKTGFPVALLGIFSTSASIIGWSLRKYPH